MYSSKGPKRASNATKASRDSLRRGGAAASPRLSPSGRCRKTPGVCTGWISKSNRSDSSTMRLTCSIISSLLEKSFSAAPTAPVLSMSTISECPASLGPHTSTTLTAPRSSLHVIGLRRSARVNSSVASSLLPSTHATAPHALSLASVPMMVACRRASAGHLQQHRASRALLHHIRSLQNESRSTTPDQGIPVAYLTRPEIQSTWRPANALSMPIICTRPRGTH